ncbi:MAG TPA: hypothetical protein VHT24_01015 [Pseudacidobacterium sp.]|nr:hypothetical protein [Pseudacidobacterium sp.]
MQLKSVGAILAQIVMLTGPWAAASAQAAYPEMAHLDQYLIADRNVEIALARSAAPKSISDHAGVLVLGRQGYETAVKGSNGFVCMVDRSWTIGINEPGFWNPKVRSPICFNAPAARSYLPILTLKTRLILAGTPKAQMFDAVQTAFDNKTLPALETGAMCYMMSRQGHLNDQAGHWHPHVMFLVPLTDAEAWGAGSPNSPIFASEDKPDRLTIFMVPVAKWSDGTVDSMTAD